MSVSFPTKAAFESFNGNLIVFNYKSLKNQKFAFDTASGVWFNTVTQQSIQADNKSKVEAGTNVITGLLNVKSEEQQWIIKDCAAPVKLSTIKKEKTEVKEVKKDDDKEDEEDDDDKKDAEKEEDDDDKLEKKVEAATKPKTLNLGKLLSTISKA